MGTHLRVLSERYSMNTNMTELRWFSKIFVPCGLDESSHSIGRAKLLPDVLLTIVIMFSLLFFRSDQISDLVKKVQSIQVEVEV